MRNWYSRKVNANDSRLPKSAVNTFVAYLLAAANAGKKLPLWLVGKYYLESCICQASLRGLVVNDDVVLALAIALWRAVSAHGEKVQRVPFTCGS